VHRPIRWLGILALAAAPLLSLAGSASAGPKEKAEAKALVAEAKTAAKQKRWPTAVEALEKADALDPSPQTKLDLARALVQLGKLVAAGKVLHEVVDAPKSRGPVAAAAKKLLADVERKVAWVRVVTKGGAGASSSTTIDGDEVDPGTEIAVDPGEHLVVVEADGFEPTEKRITLAPGEREDVELRLARAAAAPTAPPPAREAGASKLPAIVAFGVGAAGVGVGAIFGAMAFSETSRVEDECSGQNCPSRVREALDTAKTNGTISTVAFVVGGVGVATGVVLLLTSGKSKPAPEGADRVSVRPYLGPTQAGVTGAF
jgi:FimV-like protein